MADEAYTVPDIESEFWAKVHCPGCEKINWVHTGNSWDDCATIDSTGFRCWSCKQKFLWGLDEIGIEIAKAQGESVEDLNCFPEDGAKYPMGADGKIRQLEILLASLREDKKALIKVHNEAAASIRRLEARLEGQGDG